MREDAAKVAHSTLPTLGWARIVVHHQGDVVKGVAPIFEGAFSVKGDVHHIMTKDNYLRTKHQLDPQIVHEIDGYGVDSSLVIWRDSDAMTPQEEKLVASGVKLTVGEPAARPQSCAHDSLPYNADVMGTFGQKPLTSPSWYETLGFGLGDDLARRDDVVGSGMDSKILTDWNTASSLYKSSFNVSLGIIELQIQDPTCPTTPDASIPWNVDCSTVTLNDRLSLFSAWRGAKGDDGVGLWHLMSGCPTGTEVGIAWLATLCQQTSSGQAPSVVSGTAVSTSGRTEWQVIAHEIGHNFGAIHDSNSCVLLQAMLVDGSPCGYGGTCQTGRCQAGSFLEKAKAWYTQNLQISIPVTVAAGILALLLLWALFTAVRRCCVGRRGRSPTMTPVIVDPALARIRHQRLDSVDRSDPLAGLRRPPSGPPMRTPPGMPGAVPAALRPGSMVAHQRSPYQGGSTDYSAPSYNNNYGPPNWVDDRLYNGSRP
ncbi:hypothetical protein EYR36_006978 [Pleurotus pulmonarius]|nr:hypothetical protein EYR36_006978 [Pleurotus pulmonarius]